MTVPTLVVSDPPHGEVDLEVTAGLLGLDVFTAGVKARFPAPEIMWASDPVEAAGVAEKLGDTGFNVAILAGEALARLPWPDPVAYLAFDEACLRVSVGGEGVEVPYHEETVGVYCTPPPDSPLRRKVDLEQAIQSGHGPTIADALEWRTNLDLYFRQGETLRRVSIVPERFGATGEDVLKEVGRRFTGLRLDTRLAGVSPRARYRKASDRNEGAEAIRMRRGYSFGTPALRELLEAINPELRDIPQFELGSRLGYSIAPLLPGQ